jgi:hypothetical protein
LEKLQKTHEDDLSLIENLRKNHDKSSKVVEDLHANNADLARSLSSKDQGIQDLEKALTEQRESSGRRISEIVNRLKALSTPKTADPAANQAFDKRSLKIWMSANYENCVP